MSAPISPITHGIMLGAGYNLLLSIPFTALFLITQLFGVRLYTLNNKEDCSRIQKKATYCSHSTDGGKGYGYSIGRWYIMSITIIHAEDGDKYSIWLVSTAATYEAFMKAGSNNPTAPAIPGAPPPPESHLKIYERTGSFYNTWFKKREITIPLITPRDNQTPIIRDIRALSEKTGHMVAYLHGPPGTGKSMIGLLVAESYRGSYCNTLKPWQPGDSLGSLYTEVEPTKECPLIVAFDEIDGALMQIHEGIPPHKSLPIATGDKAGWNQMLDEIQRGMYPHVILILTSNKTPEFIRALDPSYIRSERVDLIREML